MRTALTAITERTGLHDVVPGAMAADRAAGCNQSGQALNSLASDESYERLQH